MALTVRKQGFLAKVKVDDITFYTLHSFANAISQGMSVDKQERTCPQ
jgi:hypothetical protein